MCFKVRAIPLLLKEGNMPHLTDYLILDTHKVRKQPIGAFNARRQFPEKGVAGIDISSLSVFPNHKTAGAAGIRKCAGVLRF